MNNKCTAFLTCDYLQKTKKLKSNFQFYFYYSSNILVYVSKGSDTITSVKLENFFTFKKMII